MDQADVLFVILDFINHLLDQADVNHANAEATIEKGEKGQVHVK